jgi:tetratricopeptide (TPR) repeat protein
MKNLSVLIFLLAIQGACSKPPPPKKPTTNVEATTPPTEKPEPAKGAELADDEFELFMSTANASASAGKYEDAIARYQTALQLKQDNNIYFELGECYRKWGDASNKNKAVQKERWGLAKQSYETFVKNGGKGPNAEKAKKAMQDLDKNLSAK